MPIWKCAFLDRCKSYFLQKGKSLMQTEQTSVYVKKYHILLGAFPTGL